MQSMVMLSVTYKLFMLSVVAPICQLAILSTLTKMLFMKGKELSKFEDAN